MANASIQTRCEDCGASLTFAAELRDTVQECPECGEYVDVVARAGNRSYDWRREFTRLWDSLGPALGQADTLQGELIRIMGKLTDEAYRNGNRNWDSDCERMLRFVGTKLSRLESVSEEERAEIEDLVAQIIEEKDTSAPAGEVSAYYLLTEKVVDWCLAHPQPILHEKDPTLRR